jgi:hypothetical protein
MTAIHTTSTFQTLLHPWDAEDATPPAVVALGVEACKVLVDFTDTRHEVVVEIDAGQPRVLIYHPLCDEPLSIRWTPNGFAVDATDLTSSDHTVTLTT